MYGQNPIVRDQYSADPSARVFGDRVYVYPSHDIFATEGKGRIGWFCMEDYHVFSSQDLSNWTDHGTIVTQNEVPWVKKNNYAMWAPDCIERNGKYYFYFPTFPADTTIQGPGFTVGVAVAEKPEGPFTPQPTFIKGVRGIDPNVFIDVDGQAYLYWSAGNIYGAKLKENMLELASEPKILGNLPSKGLKEGPYLFHRKGIYYLTYPHVENKTERLEYAISKNPLGPFEVKGVIMDESPVGCWTNHQSIIEYNKQWYLFYHSNDYSPKFDKARSIRSDSLFFNADGTIKKVTPTMRGVGLSAANKEIQIDRYSAISKTGTMISFIDTTNVFLGWKTTFNETNAWLQYNSVDFGSRNLRKAKVRVNSIRGGTLTVFTRKNEVENVIAKMEVPPSRRWSVLEFDLQKQAKGVQDLFVKLEGSNTVQVDWISFE